jgi:hypothetical protein
LPPLPGNRPRASVAGHPRVVMLSSVRLFARVTGGFHVFDLLYYLLKIVTRWILQRRIGDSANSAAALHAGPPRVRSFTLSQGRVARGSAPLVVWAPLLRLRLRGGGSEVSHSRQTNGGYSKCASSDDLSLARFHGSLSFADQGVLRDPNEPKPRPPIAPCGHPCSGLA